MDEPQKVKKACSYDEACFLSRWFFWYVLPIFQIGKQRPLDFSDLPTCSKEDDPIKLTAALEA